MEPMPTVDELAARALATYHKHFQATDPQLLSAAPGRVNLIGEHVDYCDGFVMPMAIPLYTVIVAGRSSNDVVRLVSRDAPSATACEPTVVSLPTHDQTVDSDAPWTNYVRGVLAQFGRVPAFDCVIVSSVPLGAGLSSSAALEVAMYALCQQLTGNKATGVERALACQKAEHDYAGMPCGIMDQYVVSLAAEANALLIDCRSLEFELLPMPPADRCSVLVINSNVKHELTGSEYPERRQATVDAARALGVTSLRDVSEQQLEDKQSVFTDATIARRARHVVSEIGRTQRAALALKQTDYETFGHLMNESHRSLSHDFEVSCAEVERLVALVAGCPDVQVYGTRMTGGGFGGCTVTLCATRDVYNIISHVKTHYKGASFYVCRAVDGVITKEL